MISRITQRSHAAQLRKWQALLRDLFQDIEAWAMNAGWRATPQIVLREETPWGPYDAPWLKIRKGRRVITIDPVARHVTRADGLVTIRGRLPFKKLHLARQHGKWKIYTDERIAWPEPWGKAAFLKLADALTDSWDVPPNIPRVHS